MNISLSNSDRVNSLADQVYAGFDPQGLTPDDNPDGWHSCTAVLRDLRALDSTNSGQLPIHLPSAYSPENRQKDVELSQRIPNLDRCPYSLLDVLVAFEWLRSVWPSMAENSGDFLVIDCQVLSRVIWFGAVEVSLARGLTSLTLPVPLWFLQNAGQDVETWPLVSDRPIFTQHFPDQFAWMVQGIVSPEQALRRYPAESGLELSATLLSLCGHAGAPKD